MGDCKWITGNRLVDSPNCANDWRRPFIYDETLCEEQSCSLTPVSAAKGFDALSLLPKTNLKKHDQVCIEYEYYLAICVLLLIAFASFLCFTVVALNKLKQLRDMSDLYM